MDVHGSPGYAVNPATCVNFGNVMQYASKSDSVLITNTGCDTLKITSISAGLGVYTFSPSSFIVLPGASKTFRITFSPQNTGAQNSSITLNTNAGVKTICVDGTAFPAPVFNVNPKDVSVNLSACGSFTTVPVAVQNSGQGVLLYTIPGAGGIQSQDSVHVLIMTSGVDMSYRYPNMITAITQNYSKVSFTQHSYTTASALSAALQNKKVLLFPSQITGTNYYAQMASVVQNFVSNGGVVIVCGSTYMNTNIYDLGLFTGSYASYLSGGYSMSVPDTSKAITKGLPLTVNSQYYTIYHTLTNSDKTTLVSYSNYDVVASRTIGSGTAVYIGYDYYNYDVNSQRVLANAVKSGAGSLPAWTSLSTAAGNVATNAADTVFITVNSNGLTGGIYTGNIIVQSNDPLNPSDTISCTLNVLYNPCANFTHHVANGCGSTVTFADSSVNLPNSWHWTFGDGSTSTQANPSHTYTTSGTYTVKLKVCNSFGCDSISKTVTVNPGNPPSAPLCSPVATSPCCGVGIYNVHFNTINNSSGASTEGYKDFACTQSTTVVGGQTYTLTVTTGTSYYESVSAWIDYNNNGIWETSERVLSTINQYTTHTATVTIPTTAPQNTPLRMRVGDDNYSGLTGCSSPYEGQYEDYTVLIAAAQAPSVNFSYANTNSCNGTFSFTDLSTNGPTTWSWNFGDGSLSSVQNPTHTYSQPGTYTVTLIASNNYGTSAYYQVITAGGLAASINVSGNYVIGNTLSFSSTYTAALSYSWNFGDGSSSGAQSPTHSYVNPGTYVVSLTLVTPNCVVTKYDTLNIMLTGIASFNSLNAAFVSPNPFAGTCVLHYELAESSVVSLDVLNVVGQELFSVKSKTGQSPGKYEVPLTIEAPGIYFLRMDVNGISRMYKIIRQ
jgi:PKD repeat protein